MMKKVFHWKKPQATALQVIIRIFLSLFICAAAISTVYIGRKPYGEELKEGDVSLRTIYAPIDFKYTVGVDEEKTASERQKAAATVKDIYETGGKITQEMNKTIDEFFTRLGEVQKQADLTDELKLQEAQAILKEMNLPELDLKVPLAEPNLEQAKGLTKTLLAKVLSLGIITSSQEKKLNKAGETVTIRNLDTLEEKEMTVKGLSTISQAKKDLTAQAQDLLPENRKLRVVALDLIEGILENNLKFNEALTQERRKKVFDDTPVQYKEKEVRREELIISRGERVTKEHLQKIQEMYHLQIEVNRFTYFSGATILTLIFLVIIYLYLRFYEPRIFQNTRKLVLMGTLFIIGLLLAKIITYSPLPSYAIPTAITSILIAMLVGLRPAIVITIAVSIFTGIIAGDKINVATVSFVGGIIGIIFIQGARRRSQILMTGALVGVANFSAICAIELLHGLKIEVFIKEGFWGLINGLGSAIIITGILPIFENLFKQVTNISLLELSDLNHPLMKEMILKAPGTYHHSLIVGNLAEAACDAIGANALLARVGSYFHDIGKIEKSEYFSENQVGVTAKKKHDKLTPSMSSLIITNHVKDGIELAQKYKLNQVIIDFIDQHHGSSLIYYFYRRALEKTEDDQMPREEGFRYPGPKPQTKEAAVVLLADSVEAASRALAEPTPARLKNLVHKIINNKFIDHQLDQCELTLKDLDVIAEIFAR
ncbi:MAG: HDIG domain-containing metalloprotein, partial [Candidatus Omnitrophota bacterium]